jgi:hypothetical protein
MFAATTFAPAAAAVVVSSLLLTIGLLLSIGSLPLPLLIQPITR